MSTSSFDGRFYRGAGDGEYLQLLDIARRLFTPDPEFQNLAMLYTPRWNGLVEGPKWGAWWIQNSYGTTFCALPFLTEPWTTFLQNAQDLWFARMGDGRTTINYKHYEGSFFKWTPPDGCLCDAASPDWSAPKQGDGRLDLHDWGMEFTAVGVLLQAELLLIQRDRAAIARYLPMLERCATFLESRRDPGNNLFLAGPAGNLLAPSYAGRKTADGYGFAYLAGLSIHYIAALDRLIELEAISGDDMKAAFFTERRDDARKGLRLLLDEQGCFIRSLDPDGTRHGVFGAEKHGYFEAPPNHDAVCHRVVDDDHARRIVERITSIPQLRPNTFILPNYPGYDDMYTNEGIFQYGTWINGGHWATCEARMVMAYYRTGHHDDARRSMRKLIEFARGFHLDAPLKNLGASVWFDQEPIHLCYDALGGPAAMVRGLFEYRYDRQGVRLFPHLPAGITELEQKFPIRLGTRRLWLRAKGQGGVTGARVNGKVWKGLDAQSVMLVADKLPRGDVEVIVLLGGASASGRGRSAASSPEQTHRLDGDGAASHSALLRAASVTWRRRRQRVADFVARLNKARLGGGAIAAHARLVLEAIDVVEARCRLLDSGRLAPLDDKAQAAADQSYIDAADRLYTGLAARVAQQRRSKDAGDKRVGRLGAGVVMAVGPRSVSAKQ